MEKNEQYLKRRMKNNEAARKSREKRRNNYMRLLQEAQETSNFNTYIRKELLELYKQMECPVPNDSLLFQSSTAKECIGGLLILNFKPVLGREKF